MRINAEVLRAKRLAKGDTQESLAERAELSKRTVEHLEAGEFGGRISTIRKLAEALGCPIRDIVLPESDAERDALEEEAHVA